MPTVRFQLRRDTAANWTSVNPTLSSGEPAVETDTRRQKLGDGVTPWNSLAYVADGTVKSVAGASSASGFELTGGPITQSGTLTFGISNQANARTALGAVGLTGNETIAGSKTLTSNPIAPGYTVDRAGSAGGLIFQTSGSLRWIVGKGASDDFFINRYDDTGAYVGQPLAINRATGAVTLSAALGVTSGGTGSNTAAGARTNLGLGTAAEQNIGTTGSNVPLLSGSNTWTGEQNVSARLAVTRSAASPPVTPVGDFIVLRDTFGAVSIYSGRSSTLTHATFSGYSSYGTVGAPTSIGNSNALILSFTANAWDVNTTNYANVGSIDLLSTSPHTTTNLGTYWRFTCTAPGSLVPIDVARITDTGLQMYGANTVIDANRILRNRTYTVATVPSPTGIAGAQFYCTNPAAGQARPYWSNGTEWRDATGTLLA